MTRKEIGQESITIASYNLWNVNTEWQTRMELIANMFAASNPDIIAFQEVRTLNRQSALQLVTPFRMNENLPIDGSLPMPTNADTMLGLVHELMPQYQWAVFAPMAGFSDGTQEGVAVS